MISKKVLEEYKRIYKEQFKKDISDDEALEQATSLLSLISNVYRPIPLSQLDYKFIKSVANSANENLQKLNTTIIEGLKPPPGSYVIFNNNMHCHARVNDCSRILKRLFSERDQLTKLAKEIDSATPKDWPAGSQYPENVQKIMRDENEIHDYMQQDLETLFMFGFILLDQWSIQAIQIVNLALLKKHPFSELIAFFEKDQRSPLDPIWKNLGEQMLWLHFQLRFYRNKFIVHANRPWQRGTTRGTYGNDYALFTPSPPGFLDDRSLDREIREFSKIADEKTHTSDIIQSLFNQIGKVKSKADRDRIAELFGKKGGSTATFQILGLRLLEFIDQGTKILIEIAAKNLQGINLGAPFLNSDDWLRNQPKNTN